MASSPAVASFLPSSDPSVLACAGTDTSVRPRVRGKFLVRGDRTLYLRGVTYGPFRPTDDGCEYHTPERVHRDFRRMRRAGINTVRLYTVPPRWLLDAATHHGLLVLVGLPWEQHVTFLEDGLDEVVERRVRDGVRACAGHPAVLGFTVGNEIPPSIVRWYGPKRVEAFLKRLYDAAKAEDPEALVTYVSFPTTEYLQLGFVDFVCFNVYLEEQDSLEAYLARLQTLAGERPLVMAEIGLDSRSNGRDAQAEALRWQIHSAFGMGCAGAFLFAWTDEWHRGGMDILDWDFGLTDRSGKPKPALAAAAEAFAEVPFPADTPWPSASVVVCSYNGGRTLAQTLRALSRVDYPDLEVIVVDDGSTDDTAAIAERAGVRLIRTPNHGLSHARNVGLAAATGDIVAYLDDDAYPDAHWMQYVASTFLRTDHAAVGGPNVSPPGDGWLAQCVDRAPGNPTHVLLTDEEAEHLPGCNMAFRREVLQAIGGFDTRFRIAGDDVDVCWRLQKAGYTLGFHAAALVWHHRRGSIRAFWKQQNNYGRAEAMLEVKWPEKYNPLGHVPWRGRIYPSLGLFQSLAQRWHIYYGVWGSGLFQSIYPAAPGGWQMLLLLPEWYLLVALLGVLSLLGAVWSPLLWSLPVLGLVVGGPVLQVGATAWRGAPGGAPSRLGTRWREAGVTALLHVMQPLARLLGRLRFGLTPWRKTTGRGHRPFRTRSVWRETWAAPWTLLSRLETALRTRAGTVRRGGVCDRWDLEVNGGLFGAVRVLMAVEEHGQGRQMIRFRLTPRVPAPVVGAFVLLVLLCGGAALDGAIAAEFVLGSLLLLLTARVVLEWTAVYGWIARRIDALATDEPEAGADGT